MYEMNLPENYRKGDFESKLQMVEEEIKDMKLLLMGSSLSKLWQKFNIELGALQDQRRMMIRWLGPEELKAKIKFAAPGVRPLNLKEVIPDL